MKRTGPRSAMKTVKRLPDPRSLSRSFFTGMGMALMPQIYVV